MMLIKTDGGNVMFIVLTVYLQVENYRWTWSTIQCNDTDTGEREKTSELTKKVCNYLVRSELKCMYTYFFLDVSWSVIFSPLWLLCKADLRLVCTCTCIRWAACSRESSWKLKREFESNKSGLARPHPYSPYSAYTDGQLVGMESSLSSWNESWRWVKSKA